MAVSDPNKFASVGNVKALFDSGEGFVHSANIDPDYSLVPLTGTVGQVLTRTEGGVGWGDHEVTLLWEGSVSYGSTDTGTTVEGSSKFSTFIIEGRLESSGSGDRAFAIASRVDNFITGCGLLYKVSSNKAETFVADVVNAVFIRTEGDVFYRALSIGGHVYMIRLHTNSSGVNVFVMTRVWGVS